MEEIGLNSDLVVFCFVLFFLIIIIRKGQHLSWSDSRLSSWPLAFLTQDPCLSSGV